MDKTNAAAHIVKQMLMSKSQLHPVINPAAAGGKIIATCTTLANRHKCPVLLTRMRTTSEDLTITSRLCSSSTAVDTNLKGGGQWRAQHKKTPNTGCLGVLLDMTFLLLR